MTKVDEDIQAALNLLSWIIERYYELEEENKKLRAELEKWKKDYREWIIVDARNG